ncbi:MAG: YchE family NAAT transporter [Bacteroidota bacterium]
MKSWVDYIHIITALFVITNPIGAIPLFISFTRDQSPPARQRTVRIAATAVAVVLVLSVFLGEPLLRFFGIGVPSFRVGGGILILLMAIAMLQGQPGETRHSREESADPEDRESIAVVPLAVPILAGPGAISTTIVYAHHARTIWDFAFLVFAALLVAAGVWVALSLAEPIANRLGRYGINVTTRVMGLILAAVAVEFIAGGLVQLFPKLA